MEIERIFLTDEFQINKNKDKTNSSTDVIVQLVSGEKYIASFLAFKNIERIRNENIKSGDFLSGKYFWVKNMFLIDNCTKENINSVVNHLIDEGDFNLIFEKL